MVRGLRWGILASRIPHQHFPVRQNRLKNRNDAGAVNRAPFSALTGVLSRNSCEPRVGYGLVLGLPAGCVSSSLFDLGRVSLGFFFYLRNRGIGKILFGVLGVSLLLITGMGSRQVDAHASADDQAK